MVDPLWLERGAIDAGGRLLHVACGARRHIGVRHVDRRCGPKSIASVLRRAAAEVADVAVTLLPGLLIARYLGDSSEAAKQRFLELWQIAPPRFMAARRTRRASGELSGAQWNSPREKRTSC